MLLLVGSMAFAQDEYRTVDWIDLLPPLDLQALQNAPEVSHGDVDLGATDIISQDLENISSGNLSSESSESIPFGDEFAMTEEDFFDSGPGLAEEAYQSALQSTNIVEELDGQSLRLPGFIVPLEFDDDLTITEFFVVPYFGACIHMPPPPPNQMVLVTAEEGFQLDNLYTPFWISGEMSAEVTTNALGTSAYSMTMDKLERYEEL